MSQYRFDPIRRIGVLYAPERDDRPVRLGPAGENRSLDIRNTGNGAGPANSSLCAGSDPFAPGCEGETPPEVYALRPEGSEPDGPDWQLRVVPNRYPFVAARRADETTVPGEGLEPAGEVAVTGYHEVVIETRSSTGDLADLGDRELEHVVRAWLSRIGEFSRTPGIEWVSLFRNSGPLSGASLPHPHSQLVGLPFVPDRVDGLHRARADHFAKAGVCAVCEELRTAEGRRVSESPRFVVDCPRVSRFPYEQRISPRRHSGEILTLANERDGIEEFSRLLGQQLRALKTVLPRLDYNLVLDLPPVALGQHPAAHWSLEILPRTGGIAGFELASGMWVNAVLPEVAAEKLRKAMGAGHASSDG
jgi:UDPglucose--hexose-1-phosphate uridylyltransferase